jgi:hypothetical protein
MAKVSREGSEVVLRFKVGKQAGGFARFLAGAAEALRLGHIPPTNPGAGMGADVAAMQLRQLSDSVHRANDA